MAEIGKVRLIELSDSKLEDAKLLRNAGRSDNAYYLAGYAVELMLKAILSGQFRYASRQNAFKGCLHSRSGQIGEAVSSGRRFEGA